METSQSIAKISEALSKAQGEFKPATMTAINPHFQSRYATLANIMESCRQPLSANGIAIVQATSVDGEPVRVKVTTVLAHSSGEWIRESLSIKPAVDNAQGIGSAISYAKKYSLSALVGVVTEEPEDLEDDGEAAVGRLHLTGQTAPSRKGQEKPKGAKSVKEKDSGVTEKTSDPAGKNVVPPDVKTQTPAPKASITRISSIKEIFAASAKLGETPLAMRENISKLLGLKHVIKDSAEIQDENLASITTAYRQRLLLAQNNGERKAA